MFGSAIRISLPRSNIQSYFALFFTVQCNEEPFCSEERSNLAEGSEASECNDTGPWSAAQLFHIMGQDDEVLGSFNYIGGCALSKDRQQKLII